MSHMLCLVSSEPSVTLQNGSSQHLVSGDGLSVFLGSYHVSNLPSLITPSSAPLPSSPRFMAGSGFVCSGRMIPAELG